MRNMTLRNICAAVGGELFHADALADRPVSAVITDSRRVEPGCLFVAIPGKRVDGHDFIGEAFSKGATAALCKRVPEGVGGPLILVDSIFEAVMDLAEFYRAQFDIPVIGITGSAGKTSTKEMIASVLAQRYAVLATEGNFNNELGLSQTIFRLRDEHEIAVLEMGISDFEEMHDLAKAARPDICVITNIGQAHLENLRDRDGVLEAKSEIFDFLPEDGHVVLSGDDDKLNTISDVQGIRPVRFGLDDHNAVRATDLVSEGLGGTRCTICTSSGQFPVHVPLPGKHMVRNALAGAAVGELLDLSCEEIRAGIETCMPVPGRLRVVRANGMTVVDDAYNANPASMQGALELLGATAGRRVAILGDMGELGDREEELHAATGAFAAKQSLDVLLCAGSLSRHLAEEAKKDPKCVVRHFSTREELQAALPEVLREGDTVLVKASHFMGFDAIVRQLFEEKD